MLRCLLVGLGILLVSPAIGSAQSKFTPRKWMELDSSTKVGVMREFIEIAKKDKVVLRLSAEFYVNALDTMIANAVTNNDLYGLDRSLGVVIHTIAAMEGDWDNGENKLEHAKKWMGPTNFELFKQAYPEKYNRLLEASK